MPEIPDLEAIRSFFNERILDVEMTGAEVMITPVIRTGAADFAAELTGNRITGIERYGKFLLFALADDYVMVVNPMLTGRFLYVHPSEKKKGKLVFTISLANGMQIRYADQRVMGKVYVVAADQVASVPTFGEMGPDALAVTEEDFRKRIRKHTGAIKNVLTNYKFIAGIGNAYSDEILFRARIDPFRKRSAMSDEEIGDVYRAIGETMDWAIPILHEHFRDTLHYEEWREHLKVHRKGGGDRSNSDEGRCPRCGSYLAQITPNDRVTTWCRTCQK
ncbi:MAG: DNA-formamidopyrimidine glycosylase family protein [Dehalococcoidia bacterium]